MNMSLTEGYGLLSNVTLLGDAGMNTELLSEVFKLITNFTLMGGGLWLVWGTIILAGALKDKNGPQLQNGIWQIVGGALIIVAAGWFGQYFSFEGLVK